MERIVLWFAAAIVGLLVLALVLELVDALREDE